MELQGIIINIMPEQSGTSQAGKVWKSQDYILQTDGKYPKLIAINVFGDNIEKFAIGINERITAHIEIESREFKEKWFTTVRAWKIERPAQQESGLHTPQKIESGIGDRPTEEEVINEQLPF